MNDENLPSQPYLRDLATGVQVIIDGHPLVEVPHPYAGYYRCVGYLRTHKSDGWRRGTGTLIRAGDGVGILTCAHVLYDPGVGGPAERIEFFPAMAGTRQPYGLIGAGSEMLRIPETYLAAPVRAGRNDYAVVRLHPDQVPADIDPLATMETIPLAELATVQVTGYPDVAPPQPNQVMYYSRGARLNNPTATGLLRYDASTLGGSSGSPVCRVRVGQGGTEVPDLGRVTAVHGGGVEDEYNEGVYLTTEIIQWVAAQLAH